MRGKDMRVLAMVVCVAAALLATACDGGSKGGAATPAKIMDPPKGDPVNPAMPAPSMPK